MNQSSANSALLVMDMQAYTFERFKDATNLAQSINRSIDAARSAKIPVIYVVAGFRQGFPEASDNNRTCLRVKQIGTPLDKVEAHPSVNPQPSDITILKRRVSAFTGSDLEVVLRALKIDKLVLTGVATSGVVLSTVREAADRDFQITVLSDGCNDPDAEVHDILMRKVFPRQADVLSIDEWVELVKKTV